MAATPSARIAARAVRRNLMCLAVPFITATVLSIDSALLADLVSRRSCAPSSPRVISTRSSAEPATPACGCYRRRETILNHPKGGRERGARAPIAVLATRTRPFRGFQKPIGGKRFLIVTTRLERPGGALL